MNEPPYLANLRIRLTECRNSTVWKDFFLQQIGVCEAIIIPEEQSAYIKIDSTMTNRQILEAAVARQEKIGLF